MRLRTQRNLLRALGAVLIGMVAAVAPPAAAHAGDGPWGDTKSSPCDGAISSKAGGGHGYATYTYDARRLTTRRYLIEYARSSAYGFEQCAQGVAVTPYLTSVTLQFQFNGTSLSCSNGIDASFPRQVGVSYSCTGSGATVTESLTSTCQTYSSSCHVNVGYLEVLAPAGASFANYVLTRNKVTVTNTNGDSVTWSTAWK